MLWLPRGRALQVEGMAGAKVVRQEYAWHVPE